MRSPVHFFGILFAFAVLGVAEAQSPRPQFRPALLGSGPQSLINQIDSADLVKNGQKDGAVMFCAMVAKSGEVTWSRTYRGMPGTTALEEELRKRLDKAKMVGAIYNHQPVDVILYGTVIFAVTDGKPRLRILLNQESKELKAFSDFIGPQPVVGADSKFTGLHYPTEIAVQVRGVVELGLKVDAKGNMQELRGLSEEPPLLGFGDAAMTDFRDAKFIPAFRDGDPVECDIVLPVPYQAED
jgi:hypothetical protein